jgi:hypothetical protein
MGIATSHMRTGIKPRLEIVWLELQSSDLITKVSSWQHPIGISMPAQQGLAFPKSAMPCSNLPQ